MYYEVNIKVKGRKPAVSVIESQKYQSKKFYGNHLSNYDGLKRHYLVLGNLICHVKMMKPPQKNRF